MSLWSARFRTTLSLSPSDSTLWMRHSFCFCTLRSSVWRLLIHIFISSLDEQKYGTCVDGSVLSASCRRWRDLRTANLFLVWMHELHKDWSRKTVQFCLWMISFPTIIIITILSLSAWYNIPNRLTHPNGHVFYLQEHSWTPLSDFPCTLCTFWYLQVQSGAYAHFELCGISFSCTCWPSHLSQHQVEWLVNADQYEWQMSPTK